MAVKEAQSSPGIEDDPEKASGPVKGQSIRASNGEAVAKPSYSAFSLGRRRLILGIVTAAGFFGPLAGGIYLPALPTLQRAFHTSATAINATVSVFMGVLAIAVGGFPAHCTCSSNRCNRI